MSTVTSVKKRAAKANCQRDDRAFAEFETLRRKLAKQPKREFDAERANANSKKPTR